MDGSAGGNREGGRSESPLGTVGRSGLSLGRAHADRGPQMRGAACDQLDKAWFRKNSKSKGQTPCRAQQGEEVGSVTESMGNVERV